MLALLSAASFAMSHVVSKRGLQDTSITAGVIVILTCAWLVVSVSAIGELPVTLSTRTMVIFAVSGLFAPGIARGAALAGVHVLGPSIAVPIQQGLRPLIVLPAAAVVLGEGFGPLRVAGAVVIVTGGWILSRPPNGETGDSPKVSVGEDAAVLDVGGSMPSRIQRRARAVVRRLRPGVVYPVVAAFAYSTSDVLVKSGLDTESAPALGAAISSGTGLLMWYLAHALPSVRKRFRIGRHGGWLVISGALAGLAILFLFRALDRGEVSLVAPIVATQPLFVFMFSTLILRHLEQLDRSTIVAGVLVVIGVILVSL